MQQIKFAVEDAYRIAASLGGGGEKVFSAGT